MYVSLFGGELGMLLMLLKLLRVSEVLFISTELNFYLELLKLVEIDVWRTVIW